GGLGILVGDKLRASQDLGLGITVLTFSYPEGYAKHKIEDGKLITEADPYTPEKYFKTYDERTLKTKFGDVPYKLYKGKGQLVIDTELAPRLYTEKDRIDRLKKEIVLGKVAAELFSKEKFDLLHIEESHGVFGALELHSKLKDKAKSKIRFTTHTPLPHGHERWDSHDIERLYGSIGYAGKVNISEVLTFLASKVNCVSRMHATNMKRLLHWDVGYVTNGVHLSWMHPYVKKISEKFVGNLTEEPSRLSNSKAMPFLELQEAKRVVKEKLVKLVNEKAFKNKEFDDETFTVSSARRFSNYKRNGLLLDQLNRLESYAGNKPLQIIYAGLAHQDDVEGQKMIERIMGRINTAKKVRIAYLPTYDMEIAKLMIAGSDAWTAIPRERDEACGTSWMKACMNGTIPVVTRFGAAPEFLIDKQNSIMLYEHMDEQLSVEMAGKIKKLLYLYHEDPKSFYKIAKSAMTSASAMTARRMMKEYFSRIY
ncbi:MAG: hypothetical protein GOV00_00745, partial [Candidatus Altiarchaeota archaeon]|nr:hypothetical protein [Candidatus Altiarchaeota archaeon]